MFNDPISLFRFARILGSFVLTFNLAGAGSISWSQTNADPAHQQFDSFTSGETVPTKHDSPLGGMVLAGGGRVPNEVRQKFVEMAGGPQAIIVIIPSASTDADVESDDYWKEPWEDFQVHSLQVLHTRDQSTANSKNFFADLEKATAVWISGGDQNRLAQAYLNTKTAALIETLPYRQVSDGEGRLRGGVVGGTSAGCAIASRVMIGGGRQTPTLATGFDVLPNTILDQHFSQRNRFDRLLEANRQHPDRVGIGIDERTALVVTSEKAEVLGTGNVYVVKPREVNRPNLSHIADSIDLNQAQDRILDSEKEGLADEREDWFDTFGSGQQFDLNDYIRQAKALAGALKD